MGKILERNSFVEKCRPHEVLSNQYQEIFLYYFNTVSVNFLCNVVNSYQNYITCTHFDGSEFLSSSLGKGVFN